MAELIGVCQIRTRLGWRKRWPCYGRVGHWVLSATCCARVKKVEPRDDSFTFTHEPTGFRAKDVAASNPHCMAMLRAYSRLFGNATTAIGIMRKYNKFTQRQKDFARGFRQLP